jgi:hypothetical protein
LEAPAHTPSISASLPHFSGSLLTFLTALIDRGIWPMPALPINLVLPRQIWSLPNLIS